MGVGEEYIGFWLGILRGLDGRIILRWIFRKWDEGSWAESIWLSIGTGGGHCECDNEPSGSIKSGEFNLLKTG
jgi:hypothetical protein